MNKIQESATIKRLLKNPDFKVFMKEVANFYVHEDSIVKSFTSEFVSGDKLDKLNYHIAQRNALGAVLIAEGALKEDLVSIIEELVGKEE